jgi:hypothetical protein
MAIGKAASAYFIRKVALDEAKRLFKGGGAKP